MIGENFYLWTANITSDSDFFILNMTPDHGVVNQCGVYRVVEKDSSGKRVFDLAVADHCTTSNIE